MKGTTEARAAQTNKGLLWKSSNLAPRKMKKDEAPMCWLPFKLFTTTFTYHISRITINISLSPRQLLQLQLWPLTRRWEKQGLMSQKSLKCHVYNFNAYAAPQAGKSFKVSSPAKVSILQQNCQNHFFATFINVDWGPYPIFVTCNICGAGVIFFSWSQRVKNECVFDVFWCRKSSFAVFLV